jgi:hypothetical protein
VYIKAGRLADGRRILDELRPRAQTDGVGAYEIAFIHGNIDEAFKWFDVAYQNHDSGLICLKFDPAVDVMRSDPRFQELERRAGRGSPDPCAAALLNVRLHAPDLV